MPDILFTVAILASVSGARQSAGEHCWRMAYYHGAAQNSAMMDVVGYESEIRQAEEAGHRQGLPALRKQLAEARRREAEAASMRRRDMAIAALVVMPMSDDYVPPEIRSQMPMPTYGLSAPRSNNGR